MALGFARALSRGGVEFSSAALDPLRKVDPLARHVMAGAGVDISTLKGRVLTLRALERADLVVLIAGPDEPLGALPLVPNLVRWDVEDPLGWPRDVYEDARAEIRQRVAQLLEWLDQEAADAKSEAPAPSAAPTPLEA